MTPTRTKYSPNNFNYVKMNIKACSPKQKLMEQLKQSEKSDYSKFNSTSYSNSKNQFGARKRTQSVIMTRPSIESDPDESDIYDYRQPGEMNFIKNDLKNKNLVGSSLRTVYKLNQNINIELMRDQIANKRKNKLLGTERITSFDKTQSTFKSRRNTHSSFPYTTSQDTHNEYAISKDSFATPKTYKFPKKYDHNKKINEYTAYVNAMFNSGVYSHPMTS